MPRYPPLSPRPSRASEASPVYQVAPSPAFSVTMADRGRLVVPAEVRERMNLRPGDTLTLTVEADGTAILHTRASAIARLRGAFKDLSPGRSAVDDLIAERRREAAMEERDTRALARRPSKPAK